MTRLSLTLLLSLAVISSCTSVKKSRRNHHTKSSEITTSSSQSPLALIENFYKDYLAGSGSNDRADLPFSKSFTDLLIQDRKVCQEKAGTDICGWGADGDIYLDAQEVDPKLTYDNSGFSASESTNGVIEVKFNVYPSLKNDKKYYDKNIKFMMIKENGNWVVDNIKADKYTAREEIQKEINSFNIKK